MSTYRVAQVSKAGAPLEIVERPLPEPGSQWVRIKVLACGICHSDSITIAGGMPIKYPRVPGHEVVGEIDSLGADVTGWKVGERVGVGWHGGHCGHCDNCRRGDFFACTTGIKTTGVTYDGGYATAMLAPVEGLARLPAELSPVEAAPLMCAGLTTFNALRNSGARGGDTVAVLGLGGLGHLGVQYAVKLGFRTIAIARGEDKAPLAKQLGAHHYIDSTAGDPGRALQKLGGARVILATVTNGPAMAATQSGLAPHGKLLVLGAAGNFEVSPLNLLMGKRSIAGWYSGTSIDSQDTLNFSVLTDVRSMNEVYKFDLVSEAYERMMSGKARFRVVLEM